MKQLLNSLCAMAAATALCATAQAETVYVGLGAGYGSVQAGCPSGAVTCHESDTGIKLSGGYRFSPMLSAEVGYIQFGTANTRTASANVDTETFGLFVAAAARYEIAPSWSAIGRLGLAHNRALEVTHVGAARSENSTRQFKPLIGVAINYSLDDDVSFEGALDASRAERADGSSIGVQLWSMNLQYKF